jgi:hypothetical protein
MVTTCGALFVLFCITCPGLAQQSAPSAVRQDNINALDPGSSAQSMRRDFYKSFLKPVKSEHETQPGNLSVPVFAVHSGGRVYNATGDLAALINDCVAEAAAYYTLGFDPLSAEHTDEYHELGVEIDRPGLKARTNAGYYAEPFRSRSAVAREQRPYRRGGAAVIYAECQRWHASLPHWCSYRW